MLLVYPACAAGDILQRFAMSRKFRAVCVARGLHPAQYRVAFVLEPFETDPATKRQVPFRRIDNLQDESVHAVRRERGNPCGNLVWR